MAKGHQRRNQLFFKYLSVAVAVVAMGACTKKGNDGGLDIRETLRVNVDTEPPTLDWTKGTDTTSSTITVNLMDGLTDYNLTDPELKIIPALAEKWESSEKSKVWTFHIRKGVHWTDNVELTAQHFIDSWERLLNPKTASEYSYFLFGLKNGKAYNEKKIKDFSEVGVKATDPYTLVVTLEQPASFFPELVAHQSTYPIRKDIIEKYGEDAWTSPGKIVTLGAYKLKAWEHDKSLVLERNESYYGEKAKIKNVLCYMVIEGATALNMFETGKIDVQNNFTTSAEMDKWSKKPEFHSINGLTLQYYGFNVTKKPFDNPLVRKAFAQAIDKSEIVHILKGGQTPTTSWIPAGMMGYEAARGVKFDVVKAKELLVKAGFGPGKKLPKVTLMLNTNDDHKRIAENVQAQLKRNLDVDIEVQNEEWKVYLDRLKVDPPSLFRLGWQADYPDPDNFMNLMTSYSEQNRTKWKNKSYDKLIENAVSEGDSEKRKSLYSKAQTILVDEDIPAIPLYLAALQKLVSTRVLNYPLNPLDRIELKGTSLKQ